MSEGLDEGRDAEATGHGGRAAAAVPGPSWLVAAALLLAVGYVAWHGLGRAPAAPLGGNGGGVGHLSFDTKPWREVELDGRPLGTTPLLAVPLPAGEHDLVLIAPTTSERRTHRVTIRPGETAVVVLELRR